MKGPQAVRLKKTHTEQNIKRLADLQPPPYFFPLTFPITLARC